MSKAEQLVSAWDQLYDSADKAISWLDETRSQSQRLENEADSLILDLRRLRNKAKRLGSSSAYPVTAGFFGLSQAGKSFLISALASDAEGKLLTEFDGRTLDFVEHLNPEGGGKEATGIVTRFCRDDSAQSPAGFPLELKIFSEIEIAKIFLNSYFKDFNKEKFDLTFQQDRVNALLKSSLSKAQANLVEGVSADDVVDLQDYVTDTVGKVSSVLKAGYWTNATALAPHLSIEDRANLFSILWGEIPQFTEMYIKFAHVLARLQHPRMVYAPLSAAIKNTADGGLSKADSLMNVDMISRLGTSKDETVQVLPLLENNEVGAPVDITLAELSTLTAELIFRLKNPPRVQEAAEINLLDFPGYRGRMDVKSVDDDFSIPELILRGKVAYLFERYTDSQEMNILIMCTPSNAQLEVNDVGPVLERWINKTQGDTPEIRSKRQAGLLWAITKCDIRVQTNLGKTEENLKGSWGRGGLLQQTILERFDSFDWFKEWSNGAPFNNVFLVRKPGFKVPFLVVEGELECRIVDSERDALNMMRRTFLQDEDVQLYVDKPEEKWDAMLELNDGGMNKIGEYLAGISSVAYKQSRITEQLNESIDFFKQRFESWYQSDGSDALLKQRQIATNIANVLWSKAMLLGELMQLLQLPAETIFSLYHSDSLVGLNEENKDTEEVAPSMGFDETFDLFGDTPVEAVKVTEQKVEKTQKSLFAHEVYKAWIAHMNSLSSDDNIARFFALSAQDRKVLNSLIKELVTGATRLKLEARITEAVLANEHSGFKRDQVVARQVSVVHTILSDFIAWLGYDSVPLEQRPDSRNGADKKVFEPPVNNFNQYGLPQLSPEKDEFTKKYLLDWFVALGNLCEQNAGHSAGREIDIGQNAKLGEILHAVDQANV